MKDSEQEERKGMRRKRDERRRSIKMTSKNTNKDEGTRCIKHKRSERSHKRECACEETKSDANAS